MERTANETDSPFLYKEEGNCFIFFSITRFSRFVNRQKKKSLQFRKNFT